ASPETMRREEAWNPCYLTIPGFPWVCCTSGGGSSSSSAPARAVPPRPRTVRRPGPRRRERRHRRPRNEPAHGGASPLPPRPAAARQRGSPELSPRLPVAGGITMLSRRKFLRRAVGTGLGGLALANQHTFAEAETPMSHPSDTVIFETVRTDGLAHLSHLI